MGKSPIPKTDYVMYFIRWFMVGHFNRGFYCIISIYPCVISVEAYRGGADDFKTDSPFIR